MKRRSFLQKSILGSAGAAYLLSNPLNSGAVSLMKIGVIPDLKKKLGRSVMIDSIDLLEFDGEFLTRVRSTDGVEGLCVGNGKIKSMLSMYDRNVKDFFKKNRDATQIENYLDDLYLFRRNYKFSGLSLWNSLAQIELAIFDLLGKEADLSVNQLLSEKIVRTEVPIYMSSTLRSTTAEEEVEWVGKRIEESGARAAKLKIGGRMSNNKDAYPGRSEALVKEARKQWGEDFTLYIDANGSYDVPHAIEMGKFLEEHNVGFFEEPVPWQDFAGTKAVNDALEMPVVGGEQDHNMYKWQWMIHNKGFDTVQPDIMYNGGMIRTLQVAEMARKAGINCTLHSPKRNAIGAYMLHFASITPNIGDFQEYRAELDGYSKLSPDLAVRDGKVAVPTGPGFGVDFDYDYLKRFKKVDI